jgi:hypothetical protein
MNFKKKVLGLEFTVVRVLVANILWNVFLCVIAQMKA